MTISDRRQDKPAGSRFFASLASPHACAVDAREANGKGGPFAKFACQVMSPFEDVGKMA